ncbi:MAG: ATP F0F1 synthase subunit B [Pseudomonadota bacterium]
MLIAVAHAAAEAGNAEPFYASTSFWVAASVVTFLALLIYLGIHKTLLGSLDARSAQIESELDEARKLKEEAQSLLAQRQRRQREAAKEAQDILAHAQEEAAAIKAEVSGSIDAIVERRTRLAEERIKAAESAAVKDVRQVAVEIATRAAQHVIADHLAKDPQAADIDASIENLDFKLH